MRHHDFRIGMEFWCGDKRWRCTDVGSRVVVAISLETQEVVDYVPSTDGGSPGRLARYVTDDPSWHVGPPYAIVERVFDEYDLPACSLDRDSVANGNVAA